MKRKKPTVRRKFGIELVRRVPWGTHLCQFYETKQDLVDILVPYFAEGLRGNEFCMWITSPPLEAEEAKQALEKVVPELDQYIRLGQIEIIPYTEWYLLGGVFNSERVLRGWVNKEKAALDSGFDGLRLSGNTFWLERNYWKAFAEYEEEVNNAIGNHRMIAVCTYSLGKCNADEVIDVVKNHQFALIKRSGKWELVESSETKKIQRDLLRSEKKYSVLYSSMIEGVAIHDVVYDSSGKAVDYVVTDVNPSYEKITGLPKKEATGKRASELYGTGEAPYLEVFAKVAFSGKPESFETYFPPMQKHFSISVFSPAKGKFTTVFHDITEHKKAEQALRQVKRDWERTFDSVPDLIAILDDRHKIVRANRAMANRLGKTPEECIGLYCFDVLHATDVPPEFCPHKQTMQDGQEHITEVHEDRVGGHFLLSTTPLMNESGQIIGSVHVARNITEIKRAEDEIKRLNAFQTRVFESIKDELMVIDTRDFSVLVANKALLENVGMREEDVVNKPCYAVTHRRSAQCSPPLHTCPIAEMLKTGKTVAVEHTHYNVEGNLRYVEVSASPVTDEEGKTIQAVHLARDITERKRAEHELFDALNASQRRQSEVSALLKASEAVLKNREFTQAARAIFDSCKELLGASAGYVALLSKEERQNEVLFLDSGGLPCKVDPSLPMPIRGLRAEAYRSGKVVYSNDFPKSEWVSLMPEGHVVLENVLFAPLLIDKKTVGIIGLANKPEGFTERDAMLALAFGGIASVALINSRTLETLEENEKLLKAHSGQLEKLVEERTKQLRDAERLAAIGQTAGMVGHDIRNPLQSIIGDVYLAKKDLDLLPSSEEKKSLQESIDAIEKQTEYINKIVLDLQDFAKPLNPHAEETDMQRLIAELLVRNGLPENIRAEAKVEIGAEEVMADPAYMKRILGNLISNAVQAMPNGGNLAIHAYREAGDLIVTVEDTGMGIPDEVKPRLFQPLFTTKSKGQGFGLAVVKRLTEALHGTVAFETQEGKGTKFTLRFSAPETGFFSNKHP